MALWVADEFVLWEIWILSKQRKVSSKLSILHELQNMQLFSAAERACLDKLNWLLGGFGGSSGDQIGLGIQGLLERALLCTRD